MITCHSVKVITHLLKRLGYTTDVAEDGIVAIEKVQKKRYDIVFVRVSSLPYETILQTMVFQMDVNMPRMNGLEATRKIVELMPDSALRPLIGTHSFLAAPLFFFSKCC